MPHKELEIRQTYHREWFRKKYRSDKEFREKQKRNKRTQRTVCRQCHKEFMGRKNAVFCSRECSWKWMWASGLGYQKGGKIGEWAKGRKPWNYKGRKIDGKGYVFLHNPTHPMANKRGDVAEHRMVMSDHLKRALAPWEIVHHKNRRKQDNRIENLVIVTRGQHHPMAHLICPHCGREFVPFAAEN